jgi:choline-glycine betaine transporter
MATSSTRQRSQKRAAATGRAFDPLVFWVSASLTILFVLWAVILPGSMESVVNSVFEWTTESWGWLYLWTAFLLVLASLVLWLTRFGSLMFLLLVVIYGTFKGLTEYRQAHFETPGAGEVEARAT